MDDDSFDLGGIFSEIAVNVGSSFVENLLNRGVEQLTDGPATETLTTYQQQTTQREAELIAIQQQLARYRQLEVEAGLVSAAETAQREAAALALQQESVGLAQAQFRHTQQISRQTLELKREEIQLYERRLAQEATLAAEQRHQAEQALALRRQALTLYEAELADRRRVNEAMLELRRQQQVEQLQLKMDEIQAAWDRENWASLLSREECQQLFGRAQSQHRLLLFVSPPDLSPDCPASFHHNLEREIRSELKQFVGRHYRRDTAPVEFHGKSFKSAVFDTQVAQLARLLEPLPLAVIFSDVTDEQIYLHLHLWGMPEPFQLTQRWNWEAAQEQLQAEGQSEKRSLRQVRHTLVQLHQLGAALLADIYYLSLNPTYSPQLLSLNFPGGQPLQAVVRQVQQRLQAQQLAHLLAYLQAQAERQQREEAARREREAEAEQARQAELERQQREEAARREREAEAERRRRVDLPRQRVLASFDWVTIPAGKFWMGSEKGRDDEKPRHEVYLPEYQISRVPVTNEQWAVFLQETDYQWGGRDRLWADGLPRGKERHPVVYVTWHNAQAFCEWAGVRLPTEAEWEKAARGTDERTYPWGDEQPTVSLANFGKNVGDTTPVGQYPQGASPYGLLDMAGNVWEWTSSLPEAYPYKAGDGREDASRSGDRVLRGGAFNYGSDYLRAAFRDGSFPFGRYDVQGFRVVCVPI